MTTDSPSPAAPAAPDAPTRLEWAGLVLMLGAAFLRATTSFEPIPYWSTDPTVLFLPLTGLGPSASFAADIAMILGALLLLATASRSARTPRAWESALSFAGVAAVAWHALFRSGFLIEQALLGVTWSAAILAGLASASAARQPRLRRVMLATACGLIGMLAAKGLVQVLVEHSMTVAEYKLNPERWLAAQGWAPGSTSALAFERRLMQPEATGWFGLANVYASLAAAALPMFAAAAARSWKACPRSAPGSSRTEPVLLSLGALCSAAALVLADSKGGYVACAIGLLLVALMTVSPLPRIAPISRRAAPILGLALVLAAIAGVLARGLIGDRLHELSILFRWFYLQASARIFADHPLVGVGPAGFKDAYLLAKNPLSPEEVASPHSILADYAATLGILGIAWGVLWLAWVRRAGLGLLPPLTARPPDHTAHDPALRTDQRLTLVLIALVIIAGGMIEAPGASAPAAAARVAGFVLWILVSTGVLRWARAASDEAARLHLAPACIPALVLAVHTQIEMTAATPGSAPLFMVLVGSAAGLGSLASPARPRPNTTAAVPPIAACAAALALASFCYLRARSWESALFRAAEPLALVSQFQTRAAALEQGQTRADSWASLARDMTRSGAFGPAVPADPGSIFDALRAQWPRLVALSEETLSKAPDVGSLPLMRSLNKLQVQLAGADPADAGRWIDRALETAHQVTQRFPHRSTAWSHLSSVLSILATRPADTPEDRAAAQDFRRRAIQASERAHELDPYSTFHTMALAELCAGAGEPAQAARWATTTLELDTLARLDPLKQLNDQARARMTELARSR